MLRNIILILVIILLTGSIYALNPVYDSVQAFEDAWKSDAQSWQSSLHVTTTDGLDIQFSKRIDSTVAQPIVFPDANNLLPHIGPGGIEWQSQMSFYGSGQVLSQFFGQLLSWIGPDCLEMLVASALESELQQYGLGSVVENINKYIQMGQSLDNFMVTLQNHRSQLFNMIMSKDMDTSDLPKMFEINTNLSPDEQMRLYEQKLYDKMNKKLSGDSCEVGEIVQYLNYINSSNPSNFVNGASVGSIKSRITLNLCMLYEVTMENNVVKRKGSVFHLLSSSSEIIQNYCVDKIKGLNENSSEYIKRVKYSKLFGPLIIKEEADSKLNDVVHKSSEQSDTIINITRKVLGGAYSAVIKNTLADMQTLRDSITSDKVRKASDYLIQNMVLAKQEMIEK